MDTIDRQEIETVFTANMKQLETAIIRYGNAMESAAARQERAFRKSNAAITRDANRLNESLRNAIAIGALIAAGGEVIQYEATWRNLSNTLNLYTDVIGPAEAATKRLNAVAIDASVGIGELGNLTGAAARAVRANKDAFADAGEAVFDFAELTSKAAQISNNGSAAVSGALTQLSQAIASPRVQLGEFNSIIEGTPRLAQAFADGIKEANGSVFELRQLIIAGDISGTDLISGLITQAGALREEFGAMQTGAAEAFNRLRNRLAEFIGTNQGAIDAQQGLAAAIDFVSNNLEALTDAIIVGGAALAGFWGASTLSSITTGLNGMTKGLTGTAKAMALLNGVANVFGGPWVIGITAVAAALAYFALKGDAASEAMEKLEGTLEDVGRINGRMKTDTQRLTELQAELTEAIKNQQEQIVATKRVEIAAVRERIEANKDLLKVQRDLVKAEFAAVQARVDRATETTLQDNVNILSPEARARTVLSARASAAATDPDRPGLVDPERRKEEFLRLLDQEVARNDQILANGGKLTEQQAAAYKIKADYLDLLERERVLSEQVKEALANPYTANDDFRDELGQDFYIDPNAKIYDPKAGKDEDTKDDTLKAIDEIRAAYNALFDTEIEAVQRVFRARIEAIEKSSATEQQKLEARLQAEEILSAEIGKIRAEQDAEDADYAAARDKRLKEQTASEIQLLEEVLYARDAAFGRTLSLIEREFDARRAEIEAEIENEGRRTEALAALEEERAKVIADVRQRALEDAEDFTQEDAAEAAKDRIEREAQARIDAIRAAYGEEIEAHQEAKDAIAAIIAEKDDLLNGVSQDQLKGYVDSVGSIFGDLAGIVEDYGGKNSAALKALLAVERAATFASLSIDIAKGIGKAIGLGFPQNLPVIAQVTAQGAQALALLRPKNGYQRGGHTGYGADTDVRGYVHANEYVQDAPTVRYYGIDAMRALQFRRIPKEVLQGYQRGGYVGTPPPAVMRTAARVTQAATAAATTFRQTSNIFNITQGDVTVNGGGDAQDLAAQLRAELRQSEARIAAQVLPAVANDIRRGGSELTEALQGTYALARRGS